MAGLQLTSLDQVGPPKSPRRMRLAVGAALLGALAALAWVGWVRATSHAWPWQSEPPRLSWCGRDYQDTGNQVTAARMRTASGPVRPVFRVPQLGHDQVFAPTKGWTFTVPSCPATMYLQTGSDAYRTYGILGGP